MYIYATTPEYVVCPLREGEFMYESHGRGRVHSCKIGNEIRKEECHWDYLIGLIVSFYDILQENICRVFLLLLPNSFKSYFR